MFRGTWHAGPLFETPEANFFNLELSETNVADHWSCDLADRYGIELELRTDMAPMQPGSIRRF